LVLRPKIDIIPILEDSNQKLKDTLLKQGEEYTKTATEINACFSEIYKTMESNPDAAITKSVISEYGSIQNFSEASGKGIIHLTKNFIRLIGSNLGLKLMIPPPQITISSENLPLNELAFKTSSSSSSFYGANKSPKSPHIKVETIGKEKIAKMQVYSPTTKKVGEYFDPFLQYGGQSM